MLLALTVACVLLCLWLAAPFLSAMIWALALAVLFTPLQRRLERRIGKPSIAAGLSVALIAVLVVVPISFVGQRLVEQAINGARMIETRATSGEWRRAIDTRPKLAAFVARVERRVDVPGAVRAVSSRLSTTAGSVVTGSAMKMLTFCIVFYLLFFLLRDRAAALASLRALLPLDGVETEQLLARLGDTIHATVYGTLAVASVQGLLGGLMFWWLGLPAPLLWGLVMALLAVVPVLGAFIVWIPAALFLALEGEWLRALLLAGWGMLVVGTIDNLLRPVLVGRRLKVHTVPAFLSVVGGLILFGAVGLLLGPMLLATTQFLLALWSPQIAATACSNAPTAPSPAATVAAAVSDGTIPNGG